MNVGRDAAPVVFHGNRSILVEGDGNVFAISAEGLVNRVVDNLIHEMMQTPNANITDVHRRTPADRFKSFEDGDVVCGVFSLPVLFRRQSVTFWGLPLLFHFLI